MYPGRVRVRHCACSRRRREGAACRLDVSRIAIVLLLLGCARRRGTRLPRGEEAPAGKPYSHVVTLRIGPFDVSATHDREVCSTSSSRA
jgi:hypothetical protein